MMKRRLATLILAFVLLTLLLPVVPVSAATVLSEVMPDENLRQVVRDRLSIKFGEVELLRMQDILSLDASGHDVKDITGLEFCVNLVRLDVSNNQIEDISTLAKLWSETAGTELREINLANNKISDLSPLRDLTQLDILNLSGNQVSDLSPFYREAGSYSVTVLNLSENQISDVSSLASLSKVSVLHLVDNRISDISAMTGFIGFGIGDVVSLYGNPLSATAIEETIPALTAKWVSVYWGDVALPEAETTPDATETPGVVTVSLSGPLETAVRELLVRPQGDILAYEPDMLTALDLSGLGMTDLTGLELFTNLRHLDLTGNQITDIATLLKLDKLETLMLQGNPLSPTSVSDIIPQLEADGVTVTLEDAPAPSTSATTPPATATPTTPPTPTTAPTSPASTNEIVVEPTGGGAPVGAIVGGVIGGLIVIGGAAYWFLRRRKGGGESAAA